jgi:AraC-like DNA-binding protein
MEKPELEKYGTITAWSREFGISDTTLKKYFEGSESREDGIRGRDRSNRIRIYYAESVVRRRCEGILKELPQADNKGFFILDGIRYGTKHAWASILAITPRTIGMRLQEMKGMTGRAIGGQEIPNGFYPEDVIRERCSDLLGNAPRADSTGFFKYIVEGVQERFGTVAAWAREYEGILSEPALAIKLKKTGKGITGITENNVAIQKGFFPEQVVRDICEPFRNIPKANAEGIIVFPESTEHFGTRCAWARLLGISERLLTRRLKSHTGITGRDATGPLHEHGYFAESLVRKVCADLLTTPQADSSNIFFLERPDGSKERYGTPYSWSKLLPISASAIAKRLRDSQGITAINANGTIVPNGFFSESTVRKECANLLDDIPQANEQDYFIHANVQGTNEQHATSEAWGRIWGIAPETIRKRLKGIKGITGKSSRGRIFIDRYYAESVVRDVCTDLVLPPTEHRET